MAISFDLVTRAFNEKWDKRTALSYDFKIGQGLLNYPDYFLGVRALLIEKERNQKV